MKTGATLVISFLALFPFAPMMADAADCPTWCNDRNYSTSVGYKAGYNQTGLNNCFLGYQAGYSNTSGDQNTFIGFKAGYENTAGENNTFIGLLAGFRNTAGKENTFIGHLAGRNNKTFCSGTLCVSGNYNTFLGSWSGYYNETGNRNVFLGYKAGYNEPGGSKLYIDSSDTDNPLIWGNFNTNNIVIYGGFKAIASYSSSDGRWKKNIEPLESSLEKIAHLQGVSYEWKTDEYPGFGLMEGKQIGLVAQDVEKELPELVSEDKDGYKAVSYTKLTAVLVEAVKELKTENQSQKKLIEAQRNQFEKQQAEIEELRSMIKELKS